MRITKWLPAAIVTILMALGLYWQINTVKISYVNGVHPYEEMPGKEYILQCDCYVFAWHQNIATAFPLLGVNLPSAATSLSALPKEVSKENITKEFSEVRLMDVIPKGTRMQLLSVRSEESRKMGTFISYEVKFLDDIDRPYQRVDIRSILLPTLKEGIPAIDPTIAVPWIKQ